MTVKKRAINKNITIGELVELKPKAVSYLMDKGIRCLVCGEPMWGTLEEAAKDKGYADSDIKIFVEELNRI